MWWSRNDMSIVKSGKWPRLLHILRWILRLWANNVLVQRYKQAAGDEYRPRQVDLSSLSVYSESQELHSAFPVTGLTSVQLLQLAIVSVLHSVPTNHHRCHRHFSSSAETRTRIPSGIWSRLYGSFPSALNTVKSLTSADATQQNP